MGLMREERKTNPTLHHIRKGVLALCLVSIVGGLITLGALGYQGWKLFHNPYLVGNRIDPSPSPEASEWAARVYRKEKQDHLFYTGLFEVGLVVLATGSWLAFRTLHKRTQGVPQTPLTERE
jgi:hypothetical protein